eukprot:3862717-Lingulodinium_polyedra.AAC.1
MVAKAMVVHLLVGMGTSADIDARAGRNVHTVDGMVFFAVKIVVAGIVVSPHHPLVNCIEIERTRRQYSQWLLQ